MGLDEVVEYVKMIYTTLCVVGDSATNVYQVRQGTYNSLMAKGNAVGGVREKNPYVSQC